MSNPIVWPEKDELNALEIRIRRLPGNEDIPLPAYATGGASGMDIRAAVTEDTVLDPGDIKCIPTGMALSIPEGFEGQIRPRSGLALTQGIGLVNSPGTIDSDYRGEIGIIAVNFGRRPFVVRRGDRIAQLIITRVYRAHISESQDLDTTSRGEGGFGHSGER